MQINQVLILVEHHFILRIKLIYPYRVKQTLPVFIQTKNIKIINNHFKDLMEIKNNFFQPNNGKFIKLHFLYDTNKKN